MEVKIYCNDYDKLRTTEYKQQKNSLKTDIIITVGKPIKHIK